MVEGEKSLGRASVCRNVTVSGRRTSIRMERVFWNCLDAVCTERGISLSELLTEIDEARGPMNLTAAVRLHLVVMFRRKAEVVPFRRAGLGASAVPPPFAAGVDAITPKLKP